MLHLTATAFSSRNLLVCAGESEQFTITVRNDGNKIASAFDASISRGSFSDTVHVDLASPQVTTLACAADSFGVVPPELSTAPLSADGSEDAASANDVRLGAVAENGALIPRRGEALCIQLDRTRRLAGGNRNRRGRP